MAILVCLLVITPLCIYGGWKFWKWYAMQASWQAFLTDQARIRTGGGSVVNLQVTDQRQLPQNTV
ncbi:uncharacterized protein HMPREF1541_05952 [Cyphellophora europaea CBS 101466]|uniref:Uncharacterized protein n=1 Tax=Cyphellophora europaea (strain CBS 101466) TaxID=1220924 RepID=W2RT83_CYPE1|nr:uncharacterized protein HMPREF1541_05952 [Cyphellophora europaea CBS 101466]ETN39726.1 hypothetical protein HMPREF1541_05952 [Cyphellophora europaea CBS 101466]